MATIQSFNSKIDYFWPEVNRRFPAFSKPQLVPGASLRGMAPSVYMKNLIDQDPEAIYVFIEGDPLKGACDRETAKAFYDFLFTEKLQMPSSFEVNDGMSHEEAIDMEVLPREGTRAYNDFQNYYDEQMRKVAAAKAQEEHDRRAEKLGFDPDDPDIIDIDTDGNVAGSSNTTAVGQAQNTAVGLPKKIFYAVVAHPGSSDNMLGYDRGDNRLSGRGDNRRLREDEKKLDEEVVRLDVEQTAAWDNICTALNNIAGAIRSSKLAEDEKKKILDECDAAKKTCAKFGTSVDEEMKKILGECDTNEDEDDQLKAEPEKTPVEKPEETPAPEKPAEQTDECDKCGDDDCEAGEKCGLKEEDEEDDPLNESFDIGQVSAWRELITERS